MWGSFAIAGAFIFYMHPEILLAGWLNVRALVKRIRRG